MTDPMLHFPEMRPQPSDVVPEEVEDGIEDDMPEVEEVGVRE